ncbi:zinc finger protein 544 [Aplysia californica]|uniref:Zinc finger protein 544 n=1 Tax=Aplysia californica TaxID=6500 RepID=A0ABM0JM99_APLCA|nr:zinc finger protein 544 [Aplysia californica]
MAGNFSVAFVANCVCRDFGTQTFITFEDMNLLITGMVPEKISMGEKSGQERHNKNIFYHQATDDSGMDPTTPDNTAVARTITKSSRSDTEIGLPESQLIIEQSDIKAKHRSAVVSDQEILKNGHCSNYSPKMSDETTTSLIIPCNDEYGLTKAENDGFRNSVNSPLSNFRSLSEKVQSSDRTKGMTILKRKTKPSDTSNIDANVKDGSQTRPLSTCQYCSKKFSKKYLRVHMWIHEKEKQFSCDLCKKKFLRARELISHKRTHTGERPYSCAVCSQKFVSASSLRRHELLHNRESDESRQLVSSYGCDICGKVFAQKGNLNVHLKTHSGIKEHACTQCSRSFVSSGDLKRHLRVHSKEKPFTCIECGKSFTASSSLVCHMRVHTGERPYICSECGASFSVLSHLKQHNKIHERGDLWPRKKKTFQTRDKSLTKKTQKDDSRNVQSESSARSSQLDVCQGLSSLTNRLDQSENTNCLYQHHSQDGLLFSGPDSVTNYFKSSSLSNSQVVNFTDPNAVCSSGDTIAVVIQNSLEAHTGLIDKNFVDQQPNTDTDDDIGGHIVSLSSSTLCHADVNRHTEMSFSSFGVDEIQILSYSGGSLNADDVSRVTCAPVEGSIPEYIPDVSSQKL